MVVHHWRLREPRWKVGLAINVVGAITSFIVLLVVVVSKFTIGAWIPVVVIPLFVLILSSIGRHYRKVHDAVAPPDDWKPRRYQHNVVLLVSNVNRGVLEAVNYARSLAPDRLIAVVGRGRRRGAGGARWTRGPGSDSRWSCTRSTRPTGS